MFAHASHSVIATLVPPLPWKSNVSPAITLFAPVRPAGTKVAVTGTPGSEEMKNGSEGVLLETVKL